MKDPRHVIASSFADPDDVAAFRRCKMRGGADRYCFRFGDNGEGYWGDDTTQGSGPACALPPDDLIQVWGSMADAKHQKVSVTIGDKTVICVIKDTMPWKKHITNGAGIDLNPDALTALGLEPPIMKPAIWIPVA